MNKLNIVTLEETRRFLQSSQLEELDMLEYRILLIQICSLVNQHMTPGQPLDVTRSLANQYARLSHAYSLISRTFDTSTKTDVREIAYSAVSTVLGLVKKKQAVIRQTGMNWMTA